MKKVMRRILALILAMAMSLSLLGLAWAEELISPDAAVESSSSVSIEAEASTMESDEAEPSAVDGAGAESEADSEPSMTEVTPQDDDDDDDDPATDDPEDEDDIDPDLVIDYTCGPGLTWSLSGGVLTVQGSGDMNSYQDDGSDCPWMPFRKKITQVVVDDGATSIGAYAFGDLPRLSRVELAGSVSNIGEYAFAFNDNLTSVSMPGVSSIGEHAFAQCTGLSAVSLPSGLSVLSEYAFSETALTSITIPGSVSTISEGVFSDCGELTSVTISNGVQTIGHLAFCECPLKDVTVTIPESVTKIADYAFSVSDENSPDDEELYLVQGIVVKGAVGSEAERFADANKLKFKATKKAVLTNQNTVITLGESTDDKPNEPPVTKVTLTLNAKERTLTKQDYTVKYSSKDGKGIVTVTAREDSARYEGSASQSFDISGISLEGATVTLEKTSYTWDGKAKKPAVTSVKVKQGSETITLGKNDKDKKYTVSYENNKDAGKATVTVTGKGEYTGTATATFTIKGTSIAKASGTLNKTSYSYDGKAKKPGVTVKLGKKTLKKDTDYTVSYENNVNAGKKAKAIVTGKGGYSGSLTLTFEITRASLAKAVVTATPSVMQYTGEPCVPALTVVLGGKDLVENTDYTVSYSNNIGCGTAQVKVTGIGNYTGSAAGKYKIVGTSIADAVVTVENMKYTGKALKPAVTVTLGDVTLSAGTDYTVSYKNNINAGKATVTVTGKGAYSGTAKGSFTITATPLDGAKVTAKDQKYTGKALKPAVTVKLNGKTLKEGTDYTVKYSNNTSSGTATIKVTGKGGYSGTATGSFKIIGTSIKGAKLTVADQTYSGAALKPSVKVVLGKKTLKKDTDYTVSYKNNINAGKATVTVTGKGAYSDSASTTFTIKGRSISKAQYSIMHPTYTGEPVLPKVTLKLSGINLVEGRDFTISVENNIEVGKANLIIKGIGGCTGTIKTTFTINGIPLSEAVVTLVQDSVPLTKEKRIPEVASVVLNGQELVKDVDYTVVAPKTLKVGENTMTVKGAGHYGSTVSVKFKVTEAENPIDISGADVTVWDVVYGGSSYTPALIVKVDGEDLYQGTDYTCQWERNKKIGTYPFTLTGIGLYTGQYQGTYKIVPPGPSGGTGGVDKNGKVTLQWSKVSIADGYEVQYATKSDYSNAQTEKLSGASNTKVVFKDLTLGKTYYFRVRAVSGEYASAWKLNFKMDVKKSKK